MEKKIEEEKKISVSEKLTALQIAQAMGGFDVMTIANNVSVCYPQRNIVILYFCFFFYYNESSICSDRR